MEKEEWRDIQGYEGYYQVSNLGRVRSLDKYVKNYISGFALRKGMVLKGKSDKDGYKYVTLSKYSKKKTYRIHRLVAQAFLQNPNNYQIINHKDENPSNNNVDNLEWCTIEYNNNYWTRKEKCSNSLKGIEKPYLYKPVIQYTKQGEFIKEFQSIKEAQRHTGVYQGDISRCCNGKRHSAGCFIWKYK